MLTAAPQIERERLSLVGHRLEDFADCCASWMDPEVTRFAEKCGYRELARTPLFGAPVILLARSPA